MPRLYEAMKDVISCDKLRSGANNRYQAQISEWGNPIYWRYIILFRKRTQGTETSQYLEEEKTKVIPLVVASERGLAQTNNVSALLGL